MIYICELILISQGYNSPREFLVKQVFSCFCLCMIVLWILDDLYM